MRKYLFSFAFLFGLICLGQNNEAYDSSIFAYQTELNNEYKNPEKSPLEKKDLKSFTGLAFFPIDEKYKVTAKVVRTPDTEPFNMPTTIPRSAVHWKYADLVFEIEGIEYTLEVYQSESLMKMEEYADYLFLPFLDKTNGEGSYAGGRYIELRLPEGDTIEIDFNKAYNPYCAYSSRYSCPIVPRQNRLATRIEAGVMAWDKH